MTERVKLTLPYPPSVNNLYVTLMMDKKDIVPATIEQRALSFLRSLTNGCSVSDLIAFAKNEMRTMRPVRVPSGDAKKYKKAVEKICTSRRDLRPFKGEIGVTLNVYRPRRVGDLDGTFKAVLDGLKGFAFEDDKQIVEIHAKRFDDKYKPRVEVEISEIRAEQELFPDEQKELIY